MNSPSNHEWEEGLDVDDSDLRLTPIVHPINNPHIKVGEETVMCTQEYIIKVIEDVDEDDDFMRASWLSVLEYVNVDGGIVTGCFGDVKKFLKNGKLKKVVAVIKSCTLNALGAISQ
ncbi:hypothetical protein Tco_0895790 [Tanacetum coccineum]|uniref:Uncharacterized protein n=1 Tax=Tanacetum coccineum TaxID=301880 RepID=A0ABQ5CGP6_9ASTR